MCLFGNDIEGVCMNPKDNHYGGYLMGNNLASSENYYITERKRIKAIIVNFNEFEQLDFIDKEIKTRLEELSSNYSKEYEAFMTGELFKPMYYSANYEKPKNLASFILFLNELKKDIFKIIDTRFSSNPWLKSPEEFYSLFKSLKKHSILNSEIDDFMSFFAQEKKCQMNTNIYNTCVYLYKLLELNCIQEIALNSILANGLLIGLNSRNKKYVTITFQQYANQKSKYLQDPIICPELKQALELFTSEIKI